VASSPAGEVAPGQLAHQRRAAFLKLGVNSSGFFVFGEQSEKRHASSKATDHSCTCEHLRAVSIGKHNVVSCRGLPCSGAAHLLCLQDFNTSTADWLKLSHRLIRCAAQNGCHFCPEMEPACATQPSNACIAPVGKLLKCQPAKAQPLLIVGSPM
jgi:hypothetical protein